ncbi:MAG: sensor domain-containing diguanylate cyclase [Rhizobiales bacterium]|nr:sensor domain-containing diguanylate cyclase [Hyphomicrobiales bacterium]
MGPALQSHAYDHLATSPKEEARLVELNRTGLLDTPPEPEFDNIARLVTNALNVPMAAVTLIDRERAWLKSSVGLSGSQSPRWQSFCSHAVALGETLIVPDAALDPRFVDNPSVTSDPHIRFYAGVPLTTRGGHSVGTLCAVDRLPREPSDREISILQQLAGLVVQQIELRLAANTDGLTGAMQRRAFFAAGERDLARTRRSHAPFACLFLDADHFKALNDTFGHAAGDEALRRIVSDCSSVIRSCDYVGRLGGEEFCIFLPEASHEAALQIAERVRARIGECSLGGLRLTVSIGIAVASPEDQSLAEIVRRADQAVYEAKKLGRNRVHAADSGR